jgi:hypothetical protein
LGILALLLAARFALLHTLDAQLRGVTHAGQFFAWSGVNSRPALSAATRASVKAAISAALGR